MTEFSRRVAIDTGMGAGEDAETFAIDANESERAALAKRFGLVEISSLQATGLIEVFARGRRARVTGRLTADVIQTCVMTLNPVPARVEEDFVRDFDRSIQSGLGKEGDFDTDEEDPPDPLPEEGIDIGDVVAEQFGLALDPYPRAEGAHLAAEENPEEDAQPPRESPFSVLGRLKNR